MLKLIPGLEDVKFLGSLGQAMEDGRFQRFLLEVTSLAKERGIPVTFTMGGVGVEVWRDDEDGGTIYVKRLEATANK